MKNCIIIIISLFSLSCTAQQTIVVNNAVSVKIPANTSLATKKGLAQKNLVGDGNNPVSKTFEGANVKYLYSKDGIDFALNGTNLTVKKDNLITLKNWSDRMSKGNKSYSSSIISDNTKTMLLITSVNRGKKHTYIWIYDNAVTKALTCNMLSDEKKDVTKLVNQIYSSVNFSVDTLR